MASGGIVFIAYLSYFAAVAIPILTARKHKILTRRQYAIRSSIAVALIIGATVVSEGYPTDYSDLDHLSLVQGVAWKALRLAVDIAGTAILSLWSVHRLQHIGWSKWWCLAFVAGMAGLVLWIVLMLQPARAPKAVNGANESVPGPDSSRETQIINDAN